jgi:ubiquinone/menaquinone biosynthesis C-methylase UbiE
MQKEIKTLTYYNAISKGYANLYHEEQAQKIISIKEYIPKKGMLLDLGCGDGILNKFIQKKAHLISLDISYELLKLNTNKTKIFATANNMPFKNNTFDAIITLTALQDMPKPQKTIEEIKNKLKPNGILITSFLKIATYYNLITQELEKNFKTIKIIEEEKDIIYILTK